MVSVEAFTQVINQLFEEREEITAPEDRVLSTLKMSIARCRRKYKGKKGGKGKRKLR